MKIQNPHISMPFRFGENNRVVIVEQDTIDEIADCVEAILRTPLGHFDELPDFGTPDLVFAEQPINTNALINAISQWEDRVEVLAAQHPDLLQELIARVRLDLQGRTSG